MLAGPHPRSLSLGPPTLFELRRGLAVALAKADGFRASLGPQALLLSPSVLSCPFVASKVPISSRIGTGRVHESALAAGRKSLEIKHVRVPSFDGEGNAMGSALITKPMKGVLSRSAAGLAAVCAVVNFALTSPSAAPATTGRVEGVVRLVAPQGAPITSGAYPTRRVSRPTAAASEISNVIVFARDVPRATAPAATRAQMIQQNESFVPRVVAITRGSTVEFPNSDPYFHNVFSLSRGATFDLGRFPRGESRSRTFSRPGLIKVFCHLHSHMSGSIMVFDHSHFTVPATDGGFALPDVPAGEIRISAWHERIGESVKAIVVEPGRTVRVEFALPVEDR